MTKYYCDYCGKEIEYSNAVKLEIRGQGARYRSFDTTILLHKECVSKALGFAYLSRFAVERSGVRRAKESKRKGA